MYTKQYEHSDVTFYVRNIKKFVVLFKNSMSEKYRHEFHGYKLLDKE